MGTRENNTMAEFCNKMMKTISDAKQEPDADMEFLGALEGDILTYLKPPAPGDPNAPAGGAGGGAMGAMGPAMAQVMGGGGGGGMPMGGGGGAPMMASAGPAMGNPDEFRRMMGKSVDRNLIAKLSKNGL